MTPEYKKELAEIEAKMVAAETFAKKLPIFSESIRKNRFSGNEDWISFGDRYKDIHLGWSIRRGFYRNDSPRAITNYRGDYCGHFFNIYINSLHLYDLHDEFGLYEALEGVNIFFADVRNTTFYVTDENIEAFLEALNTWYLGAKKLAQISRMQIKLDEAKKNVEIFTKRLEEAKNAQNS